MLLHVHKKRCSLWTLARCGYCASPPRGSRHLIRFREAGQAPVTTGSGPILRMSRSILHLADGLGMSSCVRVSFGGSCCPGHGEWHRNVTSCKHQPETSIGSGPQRNVCHLSKQNRTQQAISSCSHEGEPTRQVGMSSSTKPAKACPVRLWARDPESRFIETDSRGLAAA